MIGLTFLYVINWWCWDIILCWRSKTTSHQRKLLFFEAMRSIVLVSAIAFYFLGTRSFDFHQQLIFNQDFFLVSLILFGLFAAMELSLFPFHVWFENFPAKGEKEKRNFYILIRKIIFSYFMIVVLKKMSMACDPVYGEIFLNVVKWYVLTNIVMGGFYLLIHKNMMKIISSFAVINMSVGYLCIILRQDEIFKEHLLFYLFCTLLPLLGISLISNAIYIKENNDYSYKRLDGIIVNDSYLGICFSVFLLVLAGFPLTVGFSGKLLLFLDFIETGEKELFVGLILIYLFSMQTALGIVGRIFLKFKQKTKKIKLDKRHLWIHAILVFLVVAGGVNPSLFLTIHK